jgi:hypothetical protein
VIFSRRKGCRSLDTVPYRLIISRYLSYSFALLANPLPYIKEALVDGAWAEV